MLDKYGQKTDSDEKAWIKTEDKKLMVKGYKDSLVNPHILATNRNLIWIRVDEDCYRNFEKFLISQNDRFFINAQRLFTNNRAV